MKPEEIDLKSLSKQFEYEKHCRVIEQMNFEELVEFSKLYCKFYNIILDINKFKY